MHFFKLYKLTCVQIVHRRSLPICVFVQVSACKSLATCVYSVHYRVRSLPTSSHPSSDSGHWQCSQLRWGEWGLLDLKLMSMTRRSFVFVFMFLLFRHQTARPHLKPNYTGNERTHGWNIFCCSFLTETKQEWPFSGHFQSKFLLGALHFILCYCDPKIYEFLGKNNCTHNL